MEKKHKPEELGDGEGRHLRKRECVQREMKLWTRSTSFVSQTPMLFLRGFLRVVGDDHTASSFSFSLVTITMKNNNLKSDKKTQRKSLVWKPIRHTNITISINFAEKYHYES